MNGLRTMILVTAAVALPGLSGTFDASARPLQRAKPLAALQGPRAPVIPPDDYRGPDGAYGSAADMVRSIEGTPCGQACQERSFRRWNPIYPRQ